MGSMKSSNSKKLSITLPQGLNQGLKAYAKKKQSTVSGVLQEAARYYLKIRQYETFQDELSAKARTLGIFEENDVGKLIKKIRTSNK